MNLKESFYDGPIVRTLKHALSLLVVFLLLASTAVWTGRLFGHDIGQPADGTKLMPSLLPPDAALLKEMGLNEAEVKLSVCDSASWLVMKQADHSPVGIIVNSLPYAKNVKGFAGPTPLYIYLDAEGVIRGTAVGDNAESADFLQRAAHGTLVHWIGLTPQAGTHLKVDAVSGATYSSRALIANMQQCLGAVTAASTSSASEPVAGWGRTLAVCAVLLAGMLAAWRLRGKKWVRIGVLVLNVVVLGFWSGQFLSLSLLRGWIANGLDPLAYLPMVCVLGVALIMPFSAVTVITAPGCVRTAVCRNWPDVCLCLKFRVVRVCSASCRVCAWGCSAYCCCCFGRVSGAFCSTTSRSPSLLTKVCLRWSWCWARCLWWPVALCRTFGARHAARWVPCSI